MFPLFSVHTVSYLRQTDAALARGAVFEITYSQAIQSKHVATTLYDGALVDLTIFESLARHNVDLGMPTCFWKMP